MNQDLLAALEAHKDLITPATLKNVKENIGLLPQDAKERILTQLQNAVHLKDLIEEYDDQRRTALKDAAEHLEFVEKQYDEAYKSALKKAEGLEKKEDIKSAEDILGKI